MDFWSCVINASLLCELFHVLESVFLKTRTDIKVLISVQIYFLPTLVCKPFRISNIRFSFFPAIREDRTRGGRSTYQCSYTLPATSLGDDRVPFSSEISFSPSSLPSDCHTKPDISSSRSSKGTTKLKVCFNVWQFWHVFIC